MGMAVGEVVDQEPKDRGVGDISVTEAFAAEPDRAVFRARPQAVGSAGAGYCLMPYGPAAFGSQATSKGLREVATGGPASAGTTCRPRLAAVLD